MGDVDIMSLVEFAKWKRENPEEYKMVMKEMGCIINDFNEIMKKVM